VLWTGNRTQQRFVTTLYQDAKKKAPGETKFVVPRNVWDGEALPSRHECYTERK